MKKSIKIIISCIIIIMLLTVLAAPVLATELNQQHTEFPQVQTNEDGLTYDEINSDIEEHRKEIEEKNKEIEEQYNKNLKEIEEKRNGIEQFHGVFMIVWISLLVLSIGIVVAEIVYIYIAAPKCGMTRLWALVPLFSGILGLIVFILVRSNNKKNNNIASGNTSANVITCPTCNGVHPFGTAVCSIRGTRLQ